VENKQVNDHHNYASSTEKVLLQREKAQVKSFILMVDVLEINWKKISIIYYNCGKDLRLGLV
jgi:hypothetical protein